MATERIAGIKLNIDRMTDDELRGAVDAQLERFYRTETDLNTLIGYAALRGLVPTVPDGNVVSMDDYRQRESQPALFELPDAPA